MLRFMKHIFYSFVILGDQRIDLTERLIIWAKLILSFAPIAYALNAFHLWFADNQHFVNAFLIVVLLNAIVGMCKHRKTKEFDWGVFLKKTSGMIFMVIIVYYLLHALSVVAGDNLISNGFEILIQVTTIFYPSSKALKSIFILSNGEYPPKFIMKKLYNFEKDGSLKDFFNTKNNNK